MQVGFRLRDIGEDLTWLELRDFVKNVKPTGDSALYRAQHPKSWWWTPELDFLGAVLVTGQWANWQRAGGKGPKPVAVSRPKEKQRVRTKSDPSSAAELAERKRKLKGGG